MNIILIINLSIAHNIHQIPLNQQVGLHKNDLDHVKQLTRSIHEAQSGGDNTTTKLLLRDWAERRWNGKTKYIVSAGQPQTARKSYAPQRNIEAATI